MRAAILASAAALVLATGTILDQYGTLDPCSIMRQDAKALFGPSTWETLAARNHVTDETGKCLGAIWRMHTTDKALIVRR